jgi:hypothetical protein
MQETSMNSGFLAFYLARDKSLAFGVGSDYFVSVINNPNPFVMSGRDKTATWQPACAFGSWPRVLYMLEAGQLEWRTWPPIALDKLDWSDPYTQSQFDWATSQLRKFIAGDRTPPILASRQKDYAVEFRVRGSQTAAAASPELREALGAQPRKGYQSDRVKIALDRLEKRDLKVDDYTAADLRQLVLNEIPERKGKAKPSRQTVDAAIKSRWPK